jgi:hypothetical protein
MFIIFISFAFFNQSVLAGGSFIFKWGQDTKSEQPQVKHKQKKGGPPAHAPAHGYRAKRQYRYYPSKKVYYDTDRGLYFHLKVDNWEVGASLPSHLRADLGESVTFELDTDKPYVHNSDHVKMYPPKKFKGTKKKNWAKKK